MNNLAKDLDRVLFTEEEIAARVRELAGQITRDYAGKEVLAVCLLRGSAVFFADLVRKIDLPLIFDFMALSSYGGQAKPSGSVVVKKDLDTDLTGRHVLIVEDIIDTGRTLTCLKQLLAHRGAASVKICALLDKPSRRETPIEGDYIGFTIPNHFVVGYGLDFDQRYRNLPYIGILSPRIYQR